MRQDRPDERKAIFDCNRVLPIKRQVELLNINRGPVRFQPARANQDWAPDFVLVPMACGWVNLIAFELGPGVATHQRSTPRVR